MRGFSQCSPFFSSVGAWAITEVIATVPGVKWRIREDLSAEVCEAGDTVYVKPLVHLLKDNRVPLLRVKEFLGITVDKLTIVHHDPELELGKHTLTLGGRTKHNEFLHEIATRLREEGFARLGMSVPSIGLFMVFFLNDLACLFLFFAALGVFDKDLMLKEPLYMQAFRGMSSPRMNSIALANRLKDEHFDMLRETILVSFLLLLFVI